MHGDRTIVGLPGFDAAIAPFGTFHLIDFNLIQSLEIRMSRWREVPSQDLHLHLQVRDRAPALGVHVCFRGVINVEIRNTRQVFLGLYDVSSRGWEDVFYEAEDYESGGFALACRDVDLLAVTTDLVASDDRG